jgi:hypothetical protein
VVDGVVEDVLERRAVLLLGLDHPRPEAAAEDVILPPVPFVEGTCVLAVEVAHSIREVRERRLDDQVVVVAEEAARVEPPAVAPADAFQDPDEDRAVGVVQEDRRLVVSLRSDVVVRAGFGMAKRSSHAATVAAAVASERSRAPLATLASRTRHVPGT